jgi:hypothetical protein
MLDRAAGDPNAPVSSITFDPIPDEAPCFAKFDWADDFLPKWNLPVPKLQVFSMPTINIGAQQTPQTQKQEQKKEKPSYCSSTAYKVGSFVSDVGGDTQKVGAGITVVGAGVTVASWWTGAGGVAGAALMAGGGNVYTFGTAVSELGNFARYMGGQSAAVTAADALSIPLMRIPNPVARFTIDQTKTYFVDKSGLGDPCKEE